MSTALRWTPRLLLLAPLALAALLLWGYGRKHPEDVPWTKLDLTRPVGAFTRAKLAGLHGDGVRCRALLARAGIRFVAVPRRVDRPQCGYFDGVELSDAGAATLAYRPAGLATSCPVAAALALWEWHVVQPAALKRFGHRVREVETFGSYNCRRMYGRAGGDWSEHARANAVDVAGFRLDDGELVSVSADWRDGGARQHFLHDVRDGACRLFTHTLSPDYNAAHRDHLHLDEAGKGAWGWRSCR
ncbi:MAG: extensin family protein [Alphaproteobacteria bacterium]|nr:extensin family protein [Alphaproteobacteria bacterium]